MKGQGSPTGAPVNCVSDPPHSQPYGPGACMPAARLPAGAPAPELAPLLEAPVEVGAHGPVVKHGSADVLDRVLRVIARVIHHERKPTGRHAMLVQAHDDAPDVAGARKHLGATAAGFPSAWLLTSTCLQLTPPHVCALTDRAQERCCATAALCLVLLPGARLIYLLLSGVEGQVADIQRGGRLQALLKLLLTAVEAAVAVLRDNWVKLLHADAGGVSRRAALPRPAARASLADRQGCRGRAGAP